jgi:hypothetical protein
MTHLELALQYAVACAEGRLPLSECSAVWQLGTIAGLIVLGIALLTFCIGYRKLASSLPAPETTDSVPAIRGPQRRGSTSPYRVMGH